MRVAVDRSAELYGSLLVIERAEKPAHRKNVRAYWLCLCLGQNGECGNEVVVSSADLHTGNTTSCGCAHRAMMRKRVASAHPGWKGDDVQYAGVHSWLRRTYPKAGVCDHCQKVGSTEYANISQFYRRDRTDYLELCVRCHRTYDEAKGVHVRGTDGRYTKVAV